ncbi:MAG: hypothetical protein IJ008_00855 [Clostridia bacterium]|nr:hypothetical protein [Clostridia bacterium]
MIINKQKRIGKVIIFTEGENPEFEIIENIFHHYLGYTITKKRRSNKIITELQGSKYSKIILLNTPTSNIDSINNESEFFDYIFKEFAIDLDIDTTNNPVYFVFDRDPINNRQGIVEKLLKKLTSSQNDSDEQNGLLLLSYPSIESFTLSANERDSFDTKFKLGKDLKEFISDKKYNSDINDIKLEQAINEFLNFLEQKSVINNPSDIFEKLDVIGLKIFKIQQANYSRENLFFCISQLVEILIDLQIIEL